MNKAIHFLFLILMFSSCAKSVDQEALIYDNTFESNDVNGFTNGILTSFNSSIVLGNYNNDGFTLDIPNLPDHDIVDISFDLYIHDSWDGNIQLANDLIGPDIWQFKVDNKLYVNTTFSNGDCLDGNFCPPQSYPADYPNFNNNPKSGASRVDLPGICSKIDAAEGSTLYKIHKTIDHSASSISIQCLDKLTQKDVNDPKCDESWSVDNIKIKVINLR
jgi:hypothetical protein